MSNDDSDSVCDSYCGIVLSEKKKKNTDITEMLDTSYVLQNAGQCSQFQDCPTLCQTQSGFKQGHSTITAAMSVTNDIITALDGKKIMCCTLY